MSDELKAWLVQELDRRGWSHNELARRAGMSQATVSSVLSGYRNAGTDFCVKVARTLDVAPEKVLRLAGILPSAPASDDESLQELIELARNLSPEDRQEILEYVRFRYQRRKS